LDFQYTISNEDSSTKDALSSLIWTWGNAGASTPSCHKQEKPRLGTNLMSAAIILHILSSLIHKQKLFGLPKPDAAGLDCMLLLLRQTYTKSRKTCRMQRLGFWPPTCNFRQFFPFIPIPTIGDRRDRPIHPIRIVGPRIRQCTQVRTCCSLLELDLVHRICHIEKPRLVSAWRYRLLDAKPSMA
jgi:hypothetical protein